MDLYSINFIADMNQSLDTFQYEMEMTISAIRDMDALSYYTEAEGGGIFSKVISAISNLFTTIINKIKSFCNGGKPTIAKGKEKETVNLDKNPQGILNVLKNDMAGSEKLLARAAKGEVSKEEALNFVQQQELNWNGIKKVALTAVGGLGLFAISNQLSGIRDGAMDALRDYEATSGNNTAHAVASVKGSKDQKTMANNLAADIIATHMQKSSSTGIGAITNAIEQFLAKGIIKTSIVSDATALQDPKKRKEKEKQLKAETKAFRKHAANIDKFAKERDKQAESEDKANAERYSAKQGVSAAENRAYVNTNNSVDTAAVNKKDRFTVFGSRNQQKKAKKLQKTEN